MEQKYSSGGILQTIQGQTLDNNTKYFHYSNYTVDIYALIS